MTSSIVALNGTAHGARAPSSGRFWPALIVCLLGMNAAVVAVTVYFAVSDRSAATEPGYYAKALTYNDTIEQRAANTRLGWRAEPTLRPAADGRSMELTVRVVDRATAGVCGGRVSAVAFASIRSGQRQALELEERVPGEYAGSIRIDRTGVWCFRITVRKSGSVFTCDSELRVPEPAR